MINKFKVFVVLIFLAIFFASTSINNPSIPATSKSFAEDDTLKGVWVATVFNLDFPKTPTQNPSALKKELDKIVADAKDSGFNTIFFQVRPSSDAFYKSDIFPWSKYLTGKEDLSPQDNFDPLEYLTEICHKNGLKIHAWINPYRVTSTVEEKENLSENSIAKLYPDWVIDYKGKLYLNPGIPEVNDFVAKGALEIAENYDVDGIQIDDYFYPGEDFPDDWSYAEYGKEFTDKGDFRRYNTESLVRKINTEIKKANPDILFGVSPQGIWGNAQNISGGSLTSGKEAYFTAYADTKKWVEENLIDYIIPQVYWNIGYAGADFKVLSDWWSDTVSKTKVKLYMGIAAYKATEAEDFESIWYGKSGIEEIARQINLSKYDKNIHGYSLYRLSSITGNPDLFNSVKHANTGEKELFSDLSSVPWAKDAIKNLYEKGIAAGLDDGSFGVQNSITRGQFAVMLSRMLGKKVDFSENFSDVFSDKFYYNDIGSLKELGYIQGISESQFAPDSNISRQDLCVMVYRFLKKQSYIEESAPTPYEFSDSTEIRDYAKDAILTLKENGIINGYDDNTFKPKGFTTRAEACVILNRVLNNILEKSEK